ncbi:MAG: exonuclease SbcCD subunit D, partial [Bacteroidales bacterium]
QLSEQSADVLLISGDIFDTPNPSAASQALFYEFLLDAVRSNPQLQIVAVAGNHDSGARMEAPAPFFEHFRIHVRGLIQRTATEIDYRSLVVPLYERDVDSPAAYCLTVPYLRQSDLPLAEDEETNRVALFYRNAFNAAREIAADKPLIAMGHLQAVGSELTEDDQSERAIIGGLECVNPQMFDPAVYTALGHIHKAQRVSGREQVRYAGAPLPMSFAELNYKQGVQLIELRDSEIISLNRLLFDAPVKLLSLPSKPMAKDEVIQQLRSLPDKNDVQTDQSAYPYLEVKVRLNAPEPNLRYEIQKVLENKAVRFARIKTYSELERTSTGTELISLDDFRRLTPEDMAQRVWRAKYDDKGMPDNLRRLFGEVCDELNISLLKTDNHENSSC